jgi:hypothetical protein
VFNTDTATKCRRKVVSRRKRVAKQLYEVVTCKSLKFMDDDDDDDDDDEEEEEEEEVLMILLPLELPLQQP